MIIFDLDDTLIDTSGSVTPRMLEMALKRMIKHGLKVEDYAQARFQLWVLDRKTSSSRETLKLFLAYMRADPHLLEIGMEEMAKSLPPRLKVKPMKGAKKILQYLSQEYRLALVTAGSPSFQRAKWESAGIDSSLFCKIAVSEQGEKKFHYQQILTEMKMVARETLVVGDRVEKDLAPAKELGCTTIHMRWGRGLQYGASQEAVDYPISDLEEIKKILHHFELNYRA